jgi:hypothetical protein
MKSIVGGVASQLYIIFIFPVETTTFHLLHNIR